MNVFLQENKVLFLSFFLINVFFQDERVKKRNTLVQAQICSSVCLIEVINCILPDKTSLKDRIEVNKEAPLPCVVVDALH